MEFALSVCPCEQLECLTLERMTFADDGYLLGVTVKMVVVGSVSSVPSTRWITRFCARYLDNGYKTEWSAA